MAVSNYGTSYCVFSTRNTGGMLLLPQILLLLPVLLLLLQLLQLLPLPPLLRLCYSVAPTIGTTTTLLPYCYFTTTSTATTDTTTTYCYCYCCCCYYSITTPLRRNKINGSHFLFHQRAFISRNKLFRRGFMLRLSRFLPSIFAFFSASRGSCF